MSQMDRNKPKVRVSAGSGKGTAPSKPRVKVPAGSNKTPAKAPAKPRVRVPAGSGRAASSAATSAASPAASAASKVPAGGKALSATSSLARKLFTKGIGRLVPGLGLILTAAEVGQYLYEGGGFNKPSGTTRNDRGQKPGDKTSGGGMFKSPEGTKRNSRGGKSSSTAATATSNSSNSSNSGPKAPAAKSPTAPQVATNKNPPTQKAMDRPPSKSNSNPPKPTPRPSKYTRGESKGGVSFNKAFAQARKSGKSVFTWNGKKYNTKLA